MFLTAFLFTSSIMLLFMGVIWTRKGWLNVLIKFLFIISGIWSIIELLVHLGWIVKGISGG